MNLFDWILMNRLMSGALSRRDVGRLRKTMRQYRIAFRDNTSLPVISKVMTRRFQPAFIWSLFRISVEQPGYFLLGLVSAIPVVIFFTYFLVDKAYLILSN